MEEIANVIAVKEICSYCGVIYEDSKEKHEASIKHAFNYTLKKVEDDKLMSIFKHDNSTDNNLKYESFYIKMTQMQFEDQNNLKIITQSILNDNDFDVQMKKSFLVDSANFSFQDGDNDIIRIESGKKYSLCVRFESQVPLGTFTMPVLFTLYNESHGFSEKIFYTIRIEIHNEEFSKEEIKAVIVKNRFPKKRTIQIINHTGKENQYLFNYPIPDDHYKLYANGVRSFSNMSEDNENHMIHVRNILNQEITRDNYAEYFEFLLWMYEADNRETLKRRKISNVWAVIEKENLLRITIPKLVKDNKSIWKNDIIILHLLNNNTVAYQGIVCALEDNFIFVKNFDERFMQSMDALSRTLVHVSLLEKPVLYNRFHKAIRKVNFNYIFPTATTKKPTITLSQNCLFQEGIFKNHMQFIAVNNILNNISLEAPYIIFGPPGTGKTVTVVESILQIKKHYYFKHILVCAPSNAACDMLCERLSKYCSRSEMLRMHALSRDLTEIEINIQSYSNICKRTKKIKIMEPELLYEFRIVISTLGLIGRYLGTEYNPDVIFIDEVAQSSEPEADMAISLLRAGKQLILAGDPKQLGPVVSKNTEKTTLAKSIMERLMESSPLYQPQSRNPLQYNTDFVSMLVKNYRSHQDIIEISNRNFYDNSLKCFAPSDELSYKFISPLVLKQNTPKLEMGTSIEFCGLLSEEEREHQSTSYFNSKEIQMVVEYVKYLLNLPNLKILESEIGIISPYALQVEKIQKVLQNKSYKDIKVGTAESFQGQERRVIIISTVRAQDDLFRSDNKYKLGFVSNEKRFNVALTRGIAKVIVIGNPYILGYDEKHWLKFIQYCQSLNAYFGCEYNPRNDEYRKNIVELLSEKVMTIKL